jgi:hypothetical protein
VPTITQLQLSAYRSAALAARRAAEDLAELRRQLLVDLEDGAEVEIGDLSVVVRQLERRSLSFDRVAAAVGRTEAERLRSLVEPTPSTTLTVRSRSRATADA